MLQETASFTFDCCNIKSKRISPTTGRGSAFMAIRSTSVSATQHFNTRSRVSQIDLNSSCTQCAEVIFALTDASDPTPCRDYSSVHDVTTTSTD